MLKAQILNALIKLDALIGTLITAQPRRFVVVLLFVEVLIYLDGLTGLRRDLQDGDIVITILINHGLDPLLIIFVVLSGLRLVISVFLCSILLRPLINQFLLFFFHRALEDVDSRVLSVECSAACPLRVIMDKAEDGAPILLILISCLLVEIE